MKQQFTLLAEGESKEVLLARIKDCLYQTVEEGNRYFCKVDFYSEVITLSELINKMRESDKK